jgi:hypothetical protein
MLPAALSDRLLRHPDRTRWNAALRVSARARMRTVGRSCALRSRISYVAPAEVTPRGGRSVLAVCVSYLRVDGLGPVVATGTSA